MSQNLLTINAGDFSENYRLTITDLGITQKLIHIFSWAN